MKYLIILFSLLYSSLAFSGFPQGNHEKMYKDALQFKNVLRTITAGAVDPTAVATPGEPGDLYLGAGDFYIKTDSGTTTNWDIVTLGSVLDTHIADTTTHGTTGDIVGTTDTQTLSNKTLTSPIINTSVSGTAILDEDTMASDSDTQLATQQSIKAYVDNEIAGAGHVVGPASATDNAIARYDGTTGELVQDSGVLISDTNNVTGIGSIIASNQIAADNILLTDGSSSETLSINADTTGAARFTSSLNAISFGTSAFTTTGNGSFGDLFATGLRVDTIIRLNGQTIDTLGAFDLYLDAAAGQEIDANAPFNATDTLTVTGTTTLDTGLNGVLQASSGVVSGSSVDSTELGYLDGVTSDIQTQLDGKVDEVSSTDNAVTRFDGTTGSVQDSGVLIDDSDNVSGIANLTATGTTTLDTALDGALEANAGVVSSTGVDLDQIAASSQNYLDNPGFEKGISDSWSCSAGECTAETTDPLWGDTSVVFDATAANDYIRSDSKAIPEGMKGVACEARIGYTGGDDELDFRIVDGNSDTVVEGTLQAHSIYGYESLFFLCPSASAITTDSAKGDLYLEVYQTGATNAASMTLDEMYVGPTIDLTEMTLPDVMSARVDATGTVVSESADWINGDCVEGAGPNYTITCTFNSGVFTERPACQLTAYSTGSSPTTQHTAKVLNVDENTIDISRHSADTTIANGLNVFLECQKQGADAKQSVQVYKSIPKVSENVNEFNVKVNGTTGAVDTENVDFIDGDCTRNSSGDYTCDFNSGLFSSAPAAYCTPITTDGQCMVYSLSTTSLNIRTRTSGAATPADRNFSLKVTKQSDDFKLPTVQPVIVGQVQNSEQSTSIRTESAEVACSSSSLIERELGSWLTSVTNVSSGACTLTIDSGIFTEAPYCHVTSTAGSARLWISAGATSTSVTFDCQSTGGSPCANYSVYITCSGK